MTVAGMNTASAFLTQIGKPLLSHLSSTLTLSSYNFNSYSNSANANLCNDKYRRCMKASIILSFMN
jgi:hypothetical protein